jgi:hypothetical protein
MSNIARLSGLPIGQPASAKAEEIRQIIWQFPDPGTRFASPRVKHLYDWWVEAGKRGLPLRSAFDVTEHRCIIVNLFLVQVLPGGRFKFLLQGEGVTSLLGGTDARRTVSVEDDNAYDRALAQYYQQIVDDRRSRLCTGNLGHRDREFITIESIDCPLSDDGVAVSAILGVLDRI